MIHQVMVIANSGICIFNHDFSEMKINPQLFSGFTIALSNFSREMLEQEQNIETIKMSYLQFITSPFKDLLLVLIVNKYDDLKMFDAIIVELQNLFLEKYGHLDITDFNLISNFDSFHPIAEKICKTNLNIAFLAAQSDSKAALWNCLLSSEGCVDQPKKKIENWNVVQYNFSDISNCNISIWNLDLDQKEEFIIQLLEEKRIISILFEPTLSKILELIPKIYAIKKLGRNIAIYGVSLKNYGSILKENCELLLNIPVLELNLSDSSAKKHLDRLIFEAVQGKGK